MPRRRRARSAPVAATPTATPMWDPSGQLEQTVPAPSYVSPGYGSGSSLGPQPVTGPTVVRSTEPTSKPTPLGLVPQGQVLHVA